MLDDEILDLVKRSLRVRTTSYSSLDSIVTGNAYQSVRMREQMLSGFRNFSPTLFAGIPLAGHRFIDLGCNLGEKTRLAACAGADFAEGVEFEEYFVRIGGLINVYNQISNIAIRQGDVTQPGCLTRDYDIGACFSAFVYVSRNLDEILSRIGKLFILETHQLDQGWYGQYVGRVSPLMPHWALYGFSDHGRGHSDSRRAYLAFGRDRDTVAQVAFDRSEALPPDDPQLIHLDVPASPRAVGLWGQWGATRDIFRATRDRLRSVEFPDDGAVLSVLEQAIPELEAACAAVNNTKKHFATDLYWLALFKGIAALIVDGDINPENPYFVFLRELHAAGAYDPDMAFFMQDEERALARLGPRLKSLLAILRERRLPAPLVVFNPIERSLLDAHDYQPTPAMGRSEVCTTDGTTYRLQFMDGNHRFAALWLSGAETCPTVFVWTNVYGLDNKSFPLLEDAARQDGAVVQLLRDSVLRVHWEQQPAGE